MGVRRPDAPHCCWQEPISDAGFYSLNKNRLSRKWQKPLSHEACCERKPINSKMGWTCLSPQEKRPYLVINRGRQNREAEFLVNKEKSMHYPQAGSTGRA